MSFSYEPEVGDKKSTKQVEEIKIEHEAAPRPILPNFLPEADEVSESVESSQEDEVAEQLVTFREADTNLLIGSKIQPEKQLFESRLLQSNTKEDKNKFKLQQ